MEDQLLIRFLNRQCSPDDWQKINEWILLDKANEEWLFEVERIWTLKDEKRFSDKKEIDAAFDILLSRVGKSAAIESQLPSKTKYPFSRWLNYAAAILIVFLSFGVYQYLKNSQTVINVVESKRGQQLSFKLSDGTQVWLNSDSRLTYPSKFKGSQRTVNLDGEGYFEVTKNEDKPFVVNSSQLNVKVLGTKFHIKAYRNEASSVMLKEGKVEVSTVNNKHMATLHPSEQVHLLKNGSLFLEENVDTDVLDKWLAGDLVFVEEPIETIMKAFERKYDVSIIIQNEEFKKERFTYKSQADLSLTQALELLTDTQRVKYKIDNRTVFIFKNQ